MFGCNICGSLLFMKSFKAVLPAFVVFGVFVLFVGLGIYATHLSNGMKPRSLATSGEIAEAVVADKTVKGMGRATSYYLVYEFESGTSMEELVNIRNFKSIKAGSTVEVCYNDTYFTAFFEKCGT